MIVRLGLTPANFDQTKCDDFVATHDRVLDLWQERGQMAAPTPEEILKLPPELRKRWQKYLRRLPSFVSTTPLALAAASSTHDADEAAASGALDVGCLSDAEWRHLGFPEGHRSVESRASRAPANMRTICRTANCDQVPFVKRAKQLASSPIVVGTTPSQLWDERFSRLCASCKTSVVIVDRYSLTPDRRHRQSAEFLMQRLLEGLGDTCSVQWFAQREEGMGEFEYLSGLWQQAGRGGTLQLFLPGRETFAAHCHHRYIRFDHWCCVLDVGIEVFSTEATKQTEFHFRPVTEADMQVEDLLRQRGQLRIAPGRRG